MRSLAEAIHWFFDQVLNLYLRGRRSIWWCWRVTPVAPSTVLDVSCVTSLEHECCASQPHSTPSRRVTHHTTWQHSHQIRSHHMTASHRITSHDMTGHHITSLHMTWHHVMSHLMAWDYTTSLHMTWHHVTSHLMTWHYLTSRHIAWCDTTSSHTAWHTWHDRTGHDTTSCHKTSHNNMTWHQVTSQHRTWHNYLTSPGSQRHGITPRHLTAHHITTTTHHRNATNHHQNATTGGRPARKKLGLGIKVSLVLKLEPLAHLGTTGIFCFSCHRRDENQ